VRAEDDPSAELARTRALMDLQVYPQQVEQ
jgi:hypothetical protein